jgi:ribonuclease T2
MIQALKFFPTERLVRYEWRKHGICSGKTPHKYLEDVSTAQNLFKIPQGLVNPKNDQTMRLRALYWDFLKVNPSLHPGMFSINCRHGVLTEVRVCISQDMRHYQLCPQVLRQSCRTSDIFIPSFH